MKLQKFNTETVSGERLIYTASAFARRNLIHLQELGTTSYNTPHTSERQGNATFLMLYVEDGNGTINMHNTNYLLEQGTFLFLNCAIPYTLSSTDELWTISWLHFSGPNMLEIYDKFLERCGSFYFHLADPSEWKHTYQTIIQTAQGDSYVKDMKLTENLTHLLSYTIEHCWQKGLSKQNTKFHNVTIAIKEYLDEHYLENTSLDQLAQQFFINKYYLLRSFKQVYDTTIQQYILQKRITYAKELLRFSRSSITEIAYQCGFEDANYFSRIFKKNEGMSPREFQKKWTSRIL